MGRWASGNSDAGVFVGLWRRSASCSGYVSCLGQRQGVRVIIVSGYSHRSSLVYFYIHHYEGVPGRVRRRCVDYDIFGLGAGQGRSGEGR